MCPLKAATFWRIFCCNPVPVAITKKLAGAPIHLEILNGFVVIAGGIFTSNAAAEDVAEGLQVPLTTTSYDPASPGVTDAMIKLLFVAPAIELPFFLH